MLCMEVCLGAVRARELAVRVLDGNNGALCTSTGSRSCRTTRGARQDSTATLRSDNMSRLFSVVHDRVGLHQRSRAIGRRDTGLGHNTTGWHRTKDWRCTSTNGSGSNGLRVRRGCGGLGHHGRRGAISWVRRIRILRH